MFIEFSTKQVSFMAFFLFEKIGEVTSYLNRNERERRNEKETEEMRERRECMNDPELRADAWTALAQTDINRDNYQIRENFLRSDCQNQTLWWLYEPLA